MAKRVPAGEAPYRPVDEALIRSVMAGAPTMSSTAVGEDGNTATAVLEPPPVRTPIPELKPPPIRVVTRPEPRPKPVPAAVNEDWLERRDREKRVLLTRTEERDVERLVNRLAGELGTPLKLSHVLRASITMLLHAEEELVERARRATLIRPGNGNAPELAEFEHGLTLVLANAFREARPMR